MHNASFGEYQLSPVTPIPRLYSAGLRKLLDDVCAVQITKVMDKFEQQFETLDVRSSYMEGAMDA